MMDQLVRRNFCWTDIRKNSVDYYFYYFSTPVFIPKYISEIFLSDFLH